MLTDRCATMCLLVNLALLYPAHAALLQASMALDVASHWMHLHSSVLRGSSSHKSVALTGNPVLQLYYTSRPFLFLMCAGNELFYCLLYLLHFTEGPTVLPGRLGLFRAALWLSAPVALLKTLINVVHLVSASRDLAAIDRAERRARSH
ncbi:CDP-diacylglycerol--inositol 3-phosphatidyltransferase [Alligator mississippiensis]|uniref:CDP-diacylglycerol--inositol 3-phosphatidyltransferase n=2 Tax=Alligator mississippiensis TaxID=8496 RepID=A0A151N7Q0_ALLMI|nr:CDP-diacylglycerol--inositol 3-phosphatidyltransferase [Alligator mississippiensis]